MPVVRALVRRNLLVYRRDPLNAALSLLGAIVVYLLYMVFLGNVHVVAVSETNPELAGTDVRNFVHAWMFGGIVTLAAITTPLGALAVLTDDISTQRFRDFLVAPISRNQLSLSYVLSAYLVGLLMSGTVLAVSVFLLWTTTGMLLNPAALLRILGWLLVSVFAFTALWSFVVCWVRTPGAFAGLSTVVGSVSGFIAGAYIAIGMFPASVRDIVSALPFAHAGMLMRREFTAEHLRNLVGSDQEAISKINTYHGMSLSVGDYELSGGIALLSLTVVAALFTVLASRKMRRVIG